MMWMRLDQSNNSLFVWSDKILDQINYISPYLNQKMESFILFHEILIIELY